MKKKFKTNFDSFLPVIFKCLLMCLLSLPVLFALVQQVSKAEVHPLEAKNGVTSLTFVQICVRQLVWGLNVTWFFEHVLCVCAQSLSCVRLFATPQTVARQAPLPMGILQAKILEWVAMPSFRGSYQLKDRTQVSCITARFFTI